jgi:predicted dehydrogenase
MKIKIAIAGMAYRSTAFLGELKERNDCDLVACCDRYPSRMRYMAERWGISNAAFYTDFRECLKKSDFDAVMVFTPDGSHADIVVPCLKAGKYVFVEKPLEITEKKCLEIVQADQGAGGKTYVGHNLRHAPLYKRIKALMDEGVLGEVLTIQADEFYDGGRTYFRRWNRLKRNGGGLWITKACHDFDLLQWLAGTPPLAVAASSALSYYKEKDQAALYCGDCSLFKNCADAFDETRYPKDWMDHIRSAIPDGLPRPDLCLFNSDKDTFDHGMATVRFQRDILATYTVNVVAGFTNRTIRISGTRATIDGDLEKQAITVRHRDPARTETFTLMDPALAGVHGGADQSVVSDFFSFVRGEKPPAVDPAEAVIAVKMGLAAEKSCATGRWVKIRSHNDAALSSIRHH